MLDGGAGIHNMTDYLAVQFHYKVKLPNEVRTVTELVQHIMLQASGTVDVPERLTGQVFNCAVVGWGFVANDIVLHDASS